MKTEDSIRKRRSIRKYSSKNVKFSDITEICDAARLAPLAGNIAYLKIIVVSNKSKIKELAQASQQPFIADAPYVLVLCSDKSHVLKSFPDVGERYIKQQAGAAVENMLLRITDLKLASCWIGWFDDNEIKRIFKIPARVDIEALIPVAHPIKEPGKIYKQNLGQILYYDTWNNKKK